MNLLSDNFDMLKELMKKIKYEFENIDLLRIALIHSSYANEKNLKYSNERLEFLGDSVIGLIVSEELFKRYTLPEGELSRAKAILVSEKMLARIARKIELGKYLFLGKGEERNGGRKKESILADAFEALIGAVYLDGSIEHAKMVISRLLEGEYEKVVKKKVMQDYKTELQEKTQRIYKVLPEYVLVEKKGPPHACTFTVEVRILGKTFGKASGSSLKEAEKNAAKIALGVLESEEGERIR